MEQLIAKNYRLRHNEAMIEKQPATRRQSLARRVESWFTKDYVEVLQNYPYSIWGSFVRGVSFGFGTVVGATVIVAIVLLVLRQFINLPGIGRLFEQIGQTIQAAK
jgi:hypothetical protein